MLIVKLTILTLTLVVIATRLRTLQDKMSLLINASEKENKSWSRSGSATATASSTWYTPSVLPPQQVGSESKLESMATASGTCTKLFLCPACMSQQQQRTILELQGSVQALASESEMLKLRAVVAAIQNASNHDNTETTITAAGGNEQPWNNVVE